MKYFGNSLISNALYINQIKISHCPWQSKGHRFDSDILHPDYQDFAATQGLFLCLECTSGVQWSAFVDFLSVIPCDLIL
jgi:hypothetical protein